MIIKKGNGLNSLLLFLCFVTALRLRHYFSSSGFGVLFNAFGLVLSRLHGMMHHNRCKKRKVQDTSRNQSSCAVSKSMLITASKAWEKENLPSRT